MNNPEAVKVLAYWDGLIKKKQVAMIPGFTPECFNAFGSGQIATSIEAAWGPGAVQCGTVAASR